MAEVKVFYHDGRLYQEPHWILDSDMVKLINEWKDQVYAEAKRQNKQHFVYCVKTYDKDDVLKAIDFYSTPLDDEDFYERTENVYATRNAFIGAWHR